MYLLRPLAIVTLFPPHDIRKIGKKKKKGISDQNIYPVHNIFGLDVSRTSQRETGEFVQVIM